MPFQEKDSLTKVLKEFVKSEIDTKNIGVSIWVVTDIKSRASDGYISDYRCNIKHINFKYTRDDVPMVGCGLGHMKGVIKYPNVGDFVIVAFFDTQPMVLGTVYDYFSTNKDAVPLIKLDELAIVQKEMGSIILMKDNNDVIIRASDENGEFDNGAKIKISADGNFTLLNNEDYGIKSIGNTIHVYGNVVVHGSIDAKTDGDTDSAGVPSHQHPVDLPVQSNNPLAKGTWN